MIDETIVSDSKAPEDHDNVLVEPSIEAPKITDEKPHEELEDEKPHEELEEEDDLMMEVIVSSQELTQTNEEADEGEIGKPPIAQAHLKSSNVEYFSGII